METKKFKGFTLVELIIVITILAILGKIAFTSFQGFTKNARDSNRVASMSTIDTGLEFYQIQTGKYPKPEEYENGTIYTGALSLTGTTIEYSYMGKIGNQITKVLKINEIPTDPKTGDKYIYATTLDLKKYQIAGTLETDMARLNIITQTYADNGIQKAKVIGNHKEDVIYDLGNTGTYYTIVPSMIYDIAGTNILNSTGVISIVNKKGNIPYDTGNGKNNTKKARDIIKELRGQDADIIELKLPPKDQLQTMTGGELISYFENNSSYSSGVIKESMGVLSTNGDTNYVLVEQVVKGTTTSTTTTQTTLGIGPTGTFNLSSTSVTVGTEVTITDNCTTPPTSYTSSDTNVATIAGDTITTKNTGTTDIIPVGGSCNDSSAKTLTITPLTGWRALDPNCPIEDIVVGTQTWAGCNSTLGNGFEWGKKNDGTNGIISNCYNYDGTSNNITDCATWNTNMASNANPRNFFDLKQPDGTNSNGDSEFNTIWGKLYTWDNASSACTDGRHLPTNTEFNTLIDALTGNILGWNRGGSTGINNLVNRLKIPLAGIRDNDNTTFSNRGNNGNLWSNTSGEHWYFYQNTNNIAVYIGSINYGVSVRCIKDY